MIGLPRGVSVFAFDEPCDMRKSFDTLTALVTEHMKRDVLVGDLFLFVGRDRKRAKVSYFDGTGMCLFAKRLEKGQFTATWKRAKSAADISNWEKADTTNPTIHLNLRQSCDLHRHAFPVSLRAA